MSTLTSDFPNLKDSILKTTLNEAALFNHQTPQNSRQYYNFTRLLFNPFGTLLACTTEQGDTLIYNFQTRTLAQVLSHSVETRQLAWSSNGQYLYVSDCEKRLLCYDITTAEKITSIEFESNVKFISPHPSRELLLISTINEQPHLIDLASTKQLHSKEADQMQETQSFESNDRCKPLGSTSHVLLVLEDSKETLVCATFSRCGDFIIAGSSKGALYVYNSELKLQERFQYANRQAPVISIQTSQESNLVLVHGSDRSLKLYSVEVKRPQNELRLTLIRTHIDVVDRFQWKCCSFGNNSLLISAGVSDKTSHFIRIWRVEDGIHLNQFTNTEEALIDFASHPSTPIIVSIGSYNSELTIYSRSTSHIWSAYQADFTALDDNTEYVEKEDEFDRIDLNQQKEIQEMKQREVVDIGEFFSNDNLPDASFKMFSDSLIADNSIINRSDFASPKKADDASNQFNSSKVLFVHSKPSVDQRLLSLWKQRKQQQQKLQNHTRLIL